MRAPFAVADDPEIRMPSDLNESTVTMHFPKRVTITLQDTSHMIFEPGIREVPLSVANPKCAQGEYLRLCGAVPYAAPQQAVPDNEKFVALARALYEDGSLEAFSAYIQDPKRLINLFAAQKEAGKKKAKARGSETYGEMQARVERERLDRDAELKKQADAEESQRKADENAVTDATESARTGQPVAEVKAAREAKEDGLPSQDDLDIAAAEKEVAGKTDKEKAEK